MKKLMISMLAMAAMVSCSSEGILDNEEPVISGGLVPIEMTAAIGNLTTKGAIGQDASGNLTAPLTNVSFIRADGATPDWTAGDIITGVSIGTDGKITFPEDNKQYYPKDGSKANLFGYYPVPKSTDGNILKWEINGTQDIIISSALSGDKKTTGDLEIPFTHKLTQLKFNILAVDAVSGEKLKHIKVKNLKTHAQYDPTAASDQFSFDGAESDLTTEGAIQDTDISTTGIEGGTLLIEPAASAKQFSIEVVTITSGVEKTYSGTVEIGAAQNTSYDVKLSISQQEVTGKATVSQWQDGGEAPGNII